MTEGPAPSRRICFRVDAGPEVGHGHFVRCLALAEILGPKFERVFLVHRAPRSLLEGVVRCGARPERVSESPTDLLRLLSGAEVVVFDGDHLTPQALARVSARGCFTVLIDDLGGLEVDVDAVLNHAGGIASSDYRVPGHTALMLGPEYLLLRPPFLERTRRASSSSRAAETLFVCCGGSDPTDLTSKIVEASVGLGLRRREVVVGDGYEHDERLARVIARDPDGSSVQIHRDLEADRLVEVMSGCDLAACSASGIALEAACVGIGLLVLQSAGDQARLLEFLTRRGCAAGLADTGRGESLRRALRALPASARAHVERQSQTFSDSRPALRRAFASFALQQTLSIRGAVPEDLDLYLGWVNDPEVRRRSIRSEPIDRAQHASWFSERISREDAVLYVIEDREGPVGQVRFERRDDAWEIGLSIARPFRGRGLAAPMLRLALKRIAGERVGALRFRAIVADDNGPSRNAFTRIGFEPSATTTLGGREFLILERSDSRRSPADGG